MNIIMEDDGKALCGQLKVSVTEKALLPTQWELNYGGKAQTKMAKQ